ncbi:hypothetical protein LOAG_12546 [Loa loa]|uniref:Uncharacterized protein n=1 Tax=Loa loa TaxID=7209 RepID=A0A1S0TM43_LOALO|nr:hypothetical protein LOAG_12546 [Loa loa]EFO15962.1 hypothetical protein LOAG_12546 [Loa loa]
MASLYVVSATDTIVDLMNESGFSTLIKSKINDVHLFGIDNLGVSYLPSKLDLRKKKALKNLGNFMGIETIEMQQRYRKIYILLGIMTILFPYTLSSFRTGLMNQAYDVPVGMFTAIGICILYNLIGIFIPATMLCAVSGDTSI